MSSSKPDVNVLFRGRSKREKRLVIETLTPDSMSNECRTTLHNPSLVRPFGVGENTREDDPNDFRQGRGNDYAGVSRSDTLRPL